MWNIKFAFKNLKKSINITLINILGFSLGLCVTLFLIQYLLNEYNYDSFHQDKERIYRVAVKSYEKDKFSDETFVYTSELGTALNEDFPEIDQYVTVSYPKSDIFYINNSPVKIENYIYASPSFFNFFSFNLKVGDPQSVLENPYSVVITEKMATQVFGNQNPLGSQLILNNEIYIVTGISEDPPKNTDIQYNMLISFSTRYKQKNVYMGWFGGNQYIHFVKLVSASDVALFSEKMDPFMWKYINKDYEKIGIKDELTFQPLSDIHLHHNPDSASLKRSLLVFSLIAVLLLLVVVINFINLFIAGSGKQIKTMGVIKIHGASKSKMIKYLLTELGILIAGSILIAVVLGRLFHHYFEQLAGKTIPLFNETGFIFIILFVAITLIISLIAGLFPSLLLSSVQPAKILKKDLVVGKSGSGLKNGLIVFQFFISIFLIISTLTIVRQNKFAQHFDTGYEKENVLILPLQSQESKQKSELLKSEFQNINGVDKICRVSEVPYNGVTSNGYFPEGRTTPEMIHVIDVDKDFLSVLNIPLMQGNNFSDELASDNNSYLINESFAKKMNWENPVGKIIRRGPDHNVIGVVKDFNFTSLRNRIEPLIITNVPDGGAFEYILIKTGNKNIPVVLDGIEEKWKDLVPNSPFEYSFLDQKFEQVYKAELGIQKLLKSFSVLTIFIALLGLLGLSRFSIESRIKEIGVRKVNGATVKEILLLLNENYIKLILLAFMLASPASWLAMQKWLENFAYKTTISWWIFALAGVLALGIALLTVSWQSWQAATRNPVEALRYE